MGRQCFVSGELGGVAREGTGEVVRILCLVIEKEVRVDRSIA
jgi:hypothetical protein